MNLQKELRLVAGSASFGIHAGLAYASFLANGDAEYARETWQDRTDAARAWEEECTAERLLSRVLSIPGHLHPAVTCGVIARGALANLAVWNVDHPSFWPGYDLPRALALSDTTQALHGLLVSGRWIGTPGHFVQSVTSSASYVEAKREADARLRALLA